MKNPIGSFFSLLIKLIVVAGLMAVIALVSFEGVTYYLTGSTYDLREGIKETDTTQSKAEDTTEQEPVDVSDIETTLVYVDSLDNMREYIALDMYNKKTQAMDMILIPSNAEVSVSTSILKEIRDKYPKAKGTLNFLDICRMFGQDRYDLLTEIISEMTGLEIAGYDIIGVDKLSEVLDAGKSVKYNLSEVMSYRDSAGQLQLLDKGDHDLSGGEAVALITHLDGTAQEESNRLEASAAYFEEFFNQLSLGMKRGNVLEAYTRLCVSTGQEKITSKADKIGSLTADAVTVRIMQGGESDGVFTLDSQKIQLQIAALMKKSQEFGSSSSASASSQTDGDETDEEDDSRKLSIELYNAAYVSGLAGEWRDYLESEGYTITLVDNYQEEGPISTTVIRVTEDGIGEDLLEYFPNAEIETVDSFATSADIQIRIGTDSVDVPEITNTDYDVDEDEYEEMDELIPQEEYRDSSDSSDSESSDSSDSGNSDGSGDDESSYSDQSDDSEEGFFSFDTDSE